DVTKSAGLDVEIYGMGVAVGDWNNDGFPDLYITCVGQNRLFRNTGKGSFVDATHASGLDGRPAFSTSAIWVDVDRDGWPDLFVANDTQPNKLYRNQRNGTFKEAGVEAGVALNRDGKARAGMGVDAADLDGSGRPVLAVTNFDNEMIGLYRPVRAATY